MKAQVNFDSLGSGAMKLTLFDIWEKVADSGSNITADLANERIVFNAISQSSNAEIVYIYGNITSFSKVKVDVNVTDTSNAPYYSDQKLGLASTQPNTSASETIATSVPIPKTTGESHYELDISSYTGNYYIEINVSGLSGYITNITVE